MLYADAEGNGVVGTHYGGPTWKATAEAKSSPQSFSVARPTPIQFPWLLLKAVSSQGPGSFHRVTYIQRVNTQGGLAPSEPGDFEGEIAQVPYTTEYFFYRALGGGNEQD